MPESVPDFSQEATCSTPAVSSIALHPHEYADNCFELHHFTGKLLLGRNDLEELYGRIDDILSTSTSNGTPRVAEVPQ